MAQQRRARETRAAIVQGASSVFLARGYAETSLDQVTDAAGVTKGALYFHFRSKADLAGAVVAEQQRPADESLRADQRHRIAPVAFQRVEDAGDAVVEEADAGDPLAGAGDIVPHRERHAFQMRGQQRPVRLGQLQQQPVAGAPILRADHTLQPRRHPPFASPAAPPVPFGPVPYSNID